MNRALPALALLATGTLALAGCATTTPAQEPTGLSIVASTSVYGSLAEAVVGDLGTVTSLISDSAVDPHSFEASARDQLAIADADLIIENGGGYDPFIDQLVEAASSTAHVISAVDESHLLEGDDHAHDEEGDDHAEGEEHTEDDGHGHIEGFNEHVWYDFHAVSHVVEAIVAEASELDPANAATFEANGAALGASIETLETDAATLATQLGGGGAAVTEPVPVYLLEAVGLENLTPADFTEAIEEGNDVPPLALEDTLDLFAAGEVRVLAYNSQTASPETERVREAAEAAGIPVVDFTETLPEGADYVSWMTDNLDALATALQ